MSLVQGAMLYTAELTWSGRTGVEGEYQRTITRKSPGPDAVSPLAMRCLFDWEPARVTALVRAHIRLGFHPEQWKMARGVTIPKPREGRLQPGEGLQGHLPPELPRKGGREGSCLLDQQSV